MSHFNPGWLARSPSRRYKSQIEAILEAALDAVDPVNAVKRHMRVEGDALVVGEQRYDLGGGSGSGSESHGSGSGRPRRVFVVGAGKASGAMARAVEELLGDRVTAGVVNVKYGYTAETRRIELIEAGHPLPDENSIAGARRMAALLRTVTADDLVIGLISGGGSALLILPAEGITLADMEQFTDVLLRSGATINELNTVRKHLDLVKGGGLARLAFPATFVALVLSDVVGNPLDVIASGPTVPDTTTFAEAWAVLERYGIVDDVPRPIADRLRRGTAGQIPDTPKPGDPLFANVATLIVASNAVAAQAAVATAQALGYHALLLSTYIEGEAREVAKVAAAIAKEVVHSGRPLAPPACLVAGGETTVTVRGSGKGGRNQEVALAAALALDGWSNVAIVALATDGGDGPTDAAGALVDGTTVQRGRLQGLEARDFLDRNDAYPFLRAVGDLLITGPTNTNVNDLLFVFGFSNVPTASVRSPTG
ncbi:MAG: glycerate kinase [Ardenticatenaceae bacterium]|nr:glycerate kinase [Ardenticatenaceae bacterium]